MRTLLWIKNSRRDTLLRRKNQMKYRTIELVLRDQDHSKRLKDPINPSIYHLETLLPFTEAGKLAKGNANVRPPAEKKPLKQMMITVDESPETFHLKNRGITYLCTKFEYDNARKVVAVTVPDVPDDAEEDDLPKFGIADGGHTFDVIVRTIGKLREEYESKDGWTEPFVRIRFVSGDTERLVQIEEVVEALNTSLQVQAYTLDEYQNQFEELKTALNKSGFDTKLIAFRENEDREWHVLEIIQRLACFLKERWQINSPVQMYKSKGRALELYIDLKTREEFRALFDVIREVVTLPEFIQSELSRGNVVQLRSLGKLKPVKPVKRPETRPGTSYETDHKIDLAALLPMAAAFRELLVLKGDRYHWKIDPRIVFRASAKDLYQILVSRSAKARTASALGADTEYWGACVPIVLRAKDRLLEEKLSNV
jgi:hypothetical protein